MARNDDAVMLRMVSLNAYYASRCAILETELVSAKDMLSSMSDMFLKFLDSVQCETDEQREKVDELVTTVSEAGRWASE